MKLTGSNDSSFQPTQVSGQPSVHFSIQKKLLFTLGNENWYKAKVPKKEKANILSGRQVLKFCLFFKWGRVFVVKGFVWTIVWNDNDVEIDK